MLIGVTMFPTDYAIPPHVLAVEAESRGFELLWFPEHSHIPTSRKSPWPGGPELPKWYYDTYDPFVSMGAAAVVTKTIKLGTGVCLVVQRDPIHTAKEVATVDRLSDGRLLFGIGGGWNAEEMADHGTAFATRFKLMRERTEAMKEIWARSKPKYAGELVKFDEMMQWPKPVQRPHPPIIVGGGFPQGARRAIAYGNGWMPIGGRGGDTLALLPAFREMLKRLRAATRPKYRSPCSASAWTAMRSNAPATPVSTASCSVCPPKPRTRFCLSSTRAPRSCAGCEFTSGLAELPVQSVGDQHVAGLVGDAERRPGRLDHRLRRHSAGPEQRHLARPDIGLAADIPACRCRRCQSRQDHRNGSARRARAGSAR